MLLIGDEARFKGVYTGKVFEYLRCGKPILAIAPKSGVVDNLLQETGHGKAITSKEREAIKSFILRNIRLGNLARRIFTISVKPFKNMKDVA